MGAPINIPQALQPQAARIWQLLKNVPNPAIKGGGVNITSYDYPSKDTVVYRDGDETLTLTGIHVSDYGPIDWSREDTSEPRVVDEFNVLEGAPISTEYSKTETENRTLEEATTLGFETAIKTILGGEYTTGIVLSGKVSRDYAKKFGKSEGKSEARTFRIGPVTAPGKYRIESYSFSRRVSSRPMMDFHIIWERRTQSDSSSNRIEWWERVELNNKAEVLDLVMGLSPDDVGVFHSGRVVHGDYGSTTVNPDKALAPFYRQSRQAGAAIDHTVPTLQWTAEYGQGTSIKRVD